MSDGRSEVPAAGVEGLLELLPPQDNVLLLATDTLKRRMWSVIDVNWCA